jgi:hypothetical protein
MVKINELTPAMAKQAAKDVETGSRALTNIHSKIDARMGSTPSIANTQQFKDYKKTNQQNKIKAMKSGMPYGRQDGPGTGANAQRGGSLKPMFPESTLVEDIPVAELAAMAMIAGVSVPVLKAMLKAAYKTGKGLVQLQRIAKAAGVKLADRVVGEELHDFDAEEPMKSTVAVPGYGTMSIDGLMNNLIQSVTELLSKMKQGTDGMRTADYELNRNRVLTTKLAALIQALDDLQAIRKQGGARSRNIAKENEQQELPVDMDRIRDMIQKLESRGYMPPEDADLMRRAVQALASGRDTVYPQSILQLLTMVA